MAETQIPQDADCQIQGYRHDYVAADRHQKARLGTVQHSPVFQGGYDDESENDAQIRQQVAV